MTRPNREFSIYNSRRFQGQGVDAQDYTFVWDPGNILDGDATVNSETIPGLEFGDFVLVGVPYNPQNLVVCGYVSAANQARVVLANNTGGAVNLGSGTWRLRIFKAEQSG